MVGLQGFEPWILPVKSRMFWTAKLKTRQMAWALAVRLPTPWVLMITMAISPRWKVKEFTVTIRRATSLCQGADSKGWPKQLQ